MDVSPALRAWKLVVSYDGTDYRGWQVQPGAATVQGTLARVLREVTGETVLPQGSGRTDAGVHAEGQVVSVDLRAGIPAERLVRAMNRRLPSAIRVVSGEVMPDEFHARAGVLQKTYEYRVFCRGPAGGGAERVAENRVAAERVCAPWVSRFAWDCRWALSLADMRQAAGQVVGTHDFSSFAAHDPDRAARLAAAGGSADADGERVAGLSNVRTIFGSDWTERDGLLLYRVTGDGFLHHMVRNLVGTFVEVGAGRREVASMAELLESRDRRLAGPTAPAQGLFLMDVEYRSGAEPVFGERVRGEASPQKDLLGSDQALFEAVPA